MSENPDFTKVDFNRATGPVNGLSAFFIYSGMMRMLQEMFVAVNSKDLEDKTDFNKAMVEFLTLSKHTNNLIDGLIFSKDTKDVG